MSVFVTLNAGYFIVSVRRMEAERRSPVDAGIIREVTDPYRSRGYVHPVSHAIEVSHAACLVLIKILFGRPRKLSKVYRFSFFNVWVLLFV